MSSKHRFVFKLIYLYNPLLANFFKHVCLVFFFRKETQRCYSSGLQLRFEYWVVFHVSVHVHFRLRLFTNTQLNSHGKWIHFTGCPEPVLSMEIGGIVQVLWGISDRKIFLSTFDDQYTRCPIKHGNSVTNSISSYQ